MGISETHIEDDGFDKITTNRNNKKFIYTFYHVGSSSHHGIGLLIDKQLNPIFKNISDHTCMATCRISNKENHANLTVISAYAPMLIANEKDPEIRNRFYDEIDKTINSIPKRNICVLLGDFNTETGSGWNIYPNDMGKYGKGQLNNNG